MPKSFIITTTCDCCNGTGKIEVDAKHACLSLDADKRDEAMRLFEDHHKVDKDAHTLASMRPKFSAKYHAQAARLRQEITKQITDLLYSP